MSYIFFVLFQKFFLLYCLVISCASHSYPHSAQSCFFMYVTFACFLRKLKYNLGDDSTEKNDLNPFCKQASMQQYFLKTTA